MDMNAVVQRLIEAHSRKVERLTPVLRGTARDHYKIGIYDCVRAMQEAAILAEMPGGAPAAPTPPPISGPLGVQPAHSAIGGSDEVPA